MLGFDLEPVGGPRFEFPAMTYYAEQPTDRTAYITLFPIGTAMRANLCVYRDMDDPWLRAFRAAPAETLRALMPNLAAITGEFAVRGVIKIRPADLYVTTGYRQPGIVLVGDAFATSCPAAGTGVGKVFTDVERLCNVHIPRWLASDGMEVEKIAAFYDDPVKQASDVHSATKAYYLRSLSIEPGLPWQARLWARFMGRLGVGMLRQVRERMSLGAPETGDRANRDLGKAAWGLIRLLFELFDVVQCGRALRLGAFDLDLVGIGREAAAGFQIELPAVHQAGEHAVLDAAEARQIGALVRAIALHAIAAELAHVVVARMRGEIGLGVFEPLRRQALEERIEIFVVGPLALGAEAA